VSARLLVEPVTGLFPLPGAGSTSVTVPCGVEFAEPVECVATRLRASVGDDRSSEVTAEGQVQLALALLQRSGSCRDLAVDGVRSDLRRLLGDAQ
jgi:hypothetical protein